MIATRYLRHAELREPQTREPGQIREVFARVHRVIGEGACDLAALCVTDTVHEGVTHVRSDLESLRADARTQVSVQR